MALKDWEKVKEDNWFNKSREVNLTIEKGVGEDVYPFGVFLSSSYIVAGGEKYLKGFNSKPQAIKFVKEYMRNN